MPQNTNLNVTPYYDDFDKNKNFYKVLFRPGFPIQARELTTMQSIMQNQVESIGQHLFKEGAMVIPGQVGYDLQVNAILIQESFLGAAVEQYRNQLPGKIITGLNTGIKAKVLYTLSAEDSEKGYITLYVKYIESDDDTATKNAFENNEQLIADTDITFGTTLIEVGSPFCQILPANGTSIGSVAYVNNGVYFIRGYFVDVPYQYILLDQYGNNPSYRVGLEVSESIITSEDDTSLNDNAAGTSNYSAPGAHRFKISTQLVKKALDDDSDKNFIELLRISNSKIQKIVERTAYSELEKTLASRTYDESGDYTVNDFQIRMRESVNDGFNNGVYNMGAITAQGNSAGDALYSVEIGPGKAYVRGYQMETLQPTYIDLEKPRDTKAIQNSIIPFELGNWVYNRNVYGFPNFTGSSVSNSYQTLHLYDTATVTPGVAAGNLIGYARIAASEFSGDADSTFGTADDTYMSNIFDINMFTAMQLSAVQTIAQGSMIVGETTGARGFIVDGITNSNLIRVYQITGNFLAGEVISVDGREKGSISYIYKYEFTDARQIVTRDESTQAVEFTSDLVLDDIISVQGDSFVLGNSGTTLTGFNSNFAIDLRPGDYIYFNNTDYVIVSRVNPSSLSTTSYGNIINTKTQVATCIAANPPADGTYSPILRFRPSLGGRDNADLFSPMPKESIKSIADESMTVRRTFDNVSISSNSFTVTLPENEQFSSIERENYTLVVTGGTGVGNVIEVQGTNNGVAGYASFTSADRTTLQVSNLTGITTVKLTATISKNVTTKKIKSTNKMFVLKVFKTTEELDNQLFGLQYSNLYGTRIQDREISLGLPDAFRLRAVYESYDDNDPVIPSLQLVEPAFFAVGSIVTGRTSGARGLVVDFSSTTLRLTYVVLNGTFLGGETLDGYNSQNESISALINDNEGSIITGSKDITANFYLESGQRGMFYDTSRLVRVAGAPAPIRKLKVVVDWFTHQSTGDYFAGQSYTGISYAEIPKFKNNVELRDVLDFRPAIKTLYTGVGSVGSPAYVNCSTFDFKSRLFEVGGLVNATVFDIPKQGTDFRCDYDYYLRRIDKLFLTADREFQVIKGVSDDNPQPPEDIKNGMFLALLRHRPYGYDPTRDVYIKKEDNRRYTMRDIGEIEQRLSKVEYYTALSMLETDTNNLKITDANGKDRFKNGYIVDDFSSHNSSDLQHEDYRASLDFRNGQCRPSHYTTNVPLEYLPGSSTVQKTGPILTLPYEEMLVIQQPYASRVENVNPFNVFTYIGRIDLAPASDDWVDTKRLPARVENIEGDYSAVARENNVDQNGFAPVQWGSWKTEWTGETVGGTRTYLSHTNLGGGRWLGTTGWFAYVHQARDITVTNRQSRQGIRTRVVPRIDRRSMGDTLISQTSIPWIRSRNVGINVSRLKPRTQFYAFFDGQAINNYITPKLIELIKDPNTDSRTNATPFVIGEFVTGQTSGVRMKVMPPNHGYKYNPYDDTELSDTYSSETAYLNVDTELMSAQVDGDTYGNIEVGEILVSQSGARAVVKARRIITDRIGQYYGAFFIPNPNTDSNPRWATGKRVFRLTTSETNSFLTGSVSSSADSTYEASGTLNTVQENILAIRNADIVKDTVTDQRTITSTRTEVRQIGWWDPLAQSFIVDDEGGVFVTSVEFYFFSKDSNIPINCQIRSMVNGYPSNKILPFSDTTVVPDEVQLSESAAIPTKFTFRAPVFLQQGVEYALILFTDSNEYQVWISRMGDVDVTGDRTISEQPYAGVLFKSQNASTWTADQYEDLKFNLYRAKFASSAQATFTNARLGVGNGGVLRLRNNPVQTHKPDQVFVLDGTGKTFTVGARIYQKTSNALATIKSVNTITNPNQITVTDITGAFQVGSSTGGVVTYALVSSRSEGSITVLSAGLTGDFEVGSTITGQTSGATAEVTAWDSGNLLLSLKYVSADFTDSETIEQVTSGGQTISAVIDGANHNQTGDSAESYVSIAPTFAQNTKRVTVLHSNHCMHDTRNNVVITGVESEVSPTTLSAGIDDDDTSIPVNDAVAFHTTINGLSVSNSNPGYIKIGDEIITYTAISGDGKSITVLDRGANNTQAVSHAEGDIVHCYNLDGVPLTEINKTHSQIVNPTLDSYDIVTQSVARLGITTGGENATASQNIQYEVLTPSISNLVLPKTELTTRVNTISGTSINDGLSVTQNSFIDDGAFIDVLINEENYFNTPRIVCSQVNEDEELNGQKSFRMECVLATSADNVTPYIDLDRVSLITTSSRMNNPSNPNLSKNATGDPHSAVYLTKLARLTNTSRSIKVMFSAYRPSGATIDVLYKVVPPGSGQEVDEIGYEFFPSENAVVPAPTDSATFHDYEYEVSGLEFTAYQIKIVMRGANQSYTPIIEEFRAIALAS